MNSSPLTPVLLLLTALNFAGPAFGIALPQPPAEAAPTAADIAEPETTETETKAEPRSSVVIRVPLPITLANAQQVLRSLQLASDDAPATSTIESRPVVMLEFETDKNVTGAGSEWGACISLADLLASPKMNRVQTVAYIRANPNSDAAIKGQLNGHAVLVAIACSEIAMENETAIGNAGSADGDAPSYVEETYKAIAAKRYALPVEVVLSMLQKDRGLFRVTLPDKVVFTDEAELKRLDAENAGKGKEIESQTIAPANQRALLLSEQLESFRLIDHRVASKSELARELNLAPDQLTADASAGGTWKAVAIKVPEFLDQRTARWITRSIKPAMARHEANLLLLEMDDSVGDLEAGVDLARAIAELDDANVRTVAVVNQSARSGSALAALACDQLILTEGATIGGFEPAAAPGEDRPNSVGDSHRQSYRNDVQSIARLKDKDWSMMAAMIDTKIEILRYRNTVSGETRLLTEEEWISLDNAKAWDLVAEVDTVDGLTAKQLKQFSIASNIIDDSSEIETIYQLAEDPVSLAPTKSDQWVQSLASFLTSPTVASLLIMGGFFFISAEMSAPGLGAPGFLGVLCLAGFFWSQHFDGNAEWFEILLFVIGISFVLMEVFVIPGFGIFGIGGIIMVGISIVLAAQSFLVPMNIRDMERLPASLFPLIGAGVGMLVAAVVLPRILPDTPFFKNVILSPPKKSDLDLGDSKDSEATANLDHLMGRKGVAATPLMPTGRAKFGDEICDVITQGQVVDKGDAVEVIEAVANRVVVKKV